MKVRENETYLVPTMFVQAGKGTEGMKGKRSDGHELDWRMEGSLKERATQKASSSSRTVIGGDNGGKHY